MAEAPTITSSREATGTSPGDVGVAPRWLTESQPRFNKEGRRPRGRAPRAPRILRDLRLARGLTLRQLAGRSGVSLAALSQIERGRMVANPAELAGLAAALGLPSGSLAVRTMVVYEADAG